MELKNEQFKYENNWLWFGWNRATLQFVTVLVDQIRPPGTNPTIQNGVFNKQDIAFLKAQLIVGSGLTVVQSPHIETISGLTFCSQEYWSTDW